MQNREHLLGSHTHTHTETSSENGPRATKGEWTCVGTHRQKGADGPHLHQDTTAHKTTVETQSDNAVTVKECVCTTRKLAQEMVTAQMGAQTSVYSGTVPQFWIEIRTNLKNFTDGRGYCSNSSRNSAITGRHGQTGKCETTRHGYPVTIARPTQHVPSTIRRSRKVLHTYPLIQLVSPQSRREQSPGAGQTHTHTGQQRPPQEREKRTRPGWIHPAQPHPVSRSATRAWLILRSTSLEWGLLQR
jgi:hypothetical protein